MEVLLSSSVISALIAGIVAIMNAKITDKKTTAKLEAWTTAQQEDIDSFSDELELMIKSQFIILRKMQGDQLNGDVGKILTELNNFINDRAHRPVSRKRK